MMQGFLLRWGEGRAPFLRAGLFSPARRKGGDAVREQKKGQTQEVSMMVRVRLPAGAAWFFGSLSPEHRTAVILAGLEALDLLPKEEEKTPEGHGE